MLPHVIAENGEQALRDWIVLIGSAENLHFAALLAGQPRPAAAELLDPGIVELGLKVLEATERFLDSFCDRPSGVAAALGLHDLPEHDRRHCCARRRGYLRAER